MHSQIATFVFRSDLSYCVIDRHSSQVYSKEHDKCFLPASAIYCQRKISWCIYSSLQLITQISRYDISQKLMGRNLIININPPQDDHRLSGSVCGTVYLSVESPTAPFCVVRLNRIFHSSLRDQVYGITTCCREGPNSAASSQHRWYCWFSLWLHLLLYSGIDFSVFRAVPLYIVTLIRFWVQITIAYWSTSWWHQNQHCYL